MLAPGCGRGAAAPDVRGPAAGGAGRSGGRQGCHFVRHRDRARQMRAAEQSGAGRARPAPRRHHRRQPATRGGAIRCKGGRPRGAAPFFRYDVAAQGHHAFQQYPALRGRARRPPLGAHGGRPASGRLRVRLRRQPRLRVPGGPAVRGDRGAAAALERRGRAAPHRGPPLHLRAVHADARRRCPADRTAVHAGLVKPAGPRGNRSIPGTPDRDARDFRPSAAGRLRALRGSRARRARPFGAMGEDNRDRGTALPRHRDQDPYPTIRTVSRSRRARRGPSS